MVLALPFTRLRSVDLVASCDIAPLHQRAIDEEPLGSNAKFFVQCTNRVWNEPDRVDGNAYCLGLVQGAWDPTIYQSGPAGILAALPGGDGGPGLGIPLRTDHLPGNPSRHHDQRLPRCLQRSFCRRQQAYNGRSFFVWSSGDPHILGAYSYLKVGQYTAFNGIQGQQEGNLHFAGEQTSINFQGYIEGGLRSGYHCADQIGGRPGPVDDLPTDSR